MNIICVICGDEIKEPFYAEHMITHGGMGNQLGALAAKKNIPNTTPSNLPPGVTPADLPDPVFLETMAEIEKASVRVEKPIVPQPSKPQGIVEKSPPSPVAEKKITPIELTYKYTGQDNNGHEMATLETDVDGKHFVIAYCLQENKQIESREVSDLNMSENMKKAIGVKHTMLQAAGLEKSDPVNCHYCGKVLKNQRALTMHKWRAKHE